MTLQPPSSYFVGALESERNVRTAMVGFVQQLFETLRSYCDQLQGAVGPEALLFGEIVNGAKIEFAGRTLTLMSDVSLNRIEFWVTAPLQANDGRSGALPKPEWTGFIQAPSGFHDFETIHTSLPLFRYSPGSEWPYENQITELLLGRLIMPNWKDQRFDALAS
jgi:hypothetical protein